VENVSDNHKQPERARTSPAAGTVLRNLHFDLLRPSGFALGNMQFEHTIVEFGVYLLGVGVVRQAKTAAEAAISPLNPVIFAAFFIFGAVPDDLAHWRDDVACPPVPEKDPNGLMHSCFVFPGGVSFARDPAPPD
jgi:hypothetical protein